MPPVIVLFWMELILWAASTILSLFFGPKQSKPQDVKPGTIESDSIPMASAYTPIPVLFGRRWISGPNVVWWGDLKTIPIVQEVESGGGMFGLFGGGSEEVTTGYWYAIGMHLVVCHGPVDAARRIRVGDRKIAWSGNVTTNGQIFIDKQELFGGEEKEGGILGYVGFKLGGWTQEASIYLTQKLGAVPHFRGVFSVILAGVRVTANTPYIKPWAIDCQRSSGGWYPAKALIGDDSNPAHILYECLTNIYWGMGYPVSEMDDASFTAAADALYSEGFGLSLLWNQDGPLADFINLVSKHIDAALSIDPATGKFKLKLIRADYVPANLPVFNEANVISIEEFARPARGELVSQVTVVWYDASTDKNQSVTVFDMAVANSNGGEVSATVQMPGVTSSALANKVAMRELAQRSIPLAKVTFFANRDAASLVLGDAIKLNWSAYGVSDLVLRVVKLSYGELIDGRVRVECVQDAFGLPTAVYVDPPETGWVDPVSDPAPCPAETLYEMPYWQIIQERIGESAVLLGDIGDLDGFAIALGVRPSSDAFGFDVVARLSPSAAYAAAARGIFSAGGTLAADLPLSITAATVTLSGAVDLEDAPAPILGLIDSEFVWITAVDSTLSQAVFDRGVLDTVPAAHTAGARLWICGRRRNAQLRATYLQNDVLRAKLLPSTGNGTLVEASAIERTLTLNKRFIRPLPPGKFRLNGLDFPAVIAGDLTVTWASRNRQTQTETPPVLQSAATIAGETGQTYTLRLYGEAGTLKKTYSGLAAETQAWTTEGADSGNPNSRPNGSLSVQIESVRDGHTSWQYQASGVVDRCGYGFNYGKYYGGFTGLSFAGSATTYTYGDSFVANPTGQRYFRLTITRWRHNGVDGSGAGTDVRIAEWQLFNASNAQQPSSPLTAANAPSPYVAIWSDDDGSRPGWRALDGNTIDSNRWITNAAGGAHWLQIDIGAGNGFEPTYTKIAPDGAVDVGGGYFPLDFKIEASNTGAFGGEQIVLFSTTGVTTGWANSTLRQFNF